MFHKVNFHKFLIFILLSALILPGFLISPAGLETRVFAQEDCVTKEECEALLKKWEEEIKKLEGVIGKTEQEKKTLQNRISSLRSAIQKLDLQIQQGNVMIKDLSYQIGDTESSIEQTSLKIEDLKGKLAVILQTIYEEDQSSIVEVLLSNDNLSDFFDNLMALESLNLKSREFLGEIKALKLTLGEQKQALDTEKGDLEKVVKMQTLQKQESQTTRSEQEKLLQMTETQYQQYLKEKTVAEKAAAEIRARIFELVGVPEAPTFGEAYDIAKYVEGLTGVRPALLLAVLTQESNLGKNVGQCYLTNLQTGAGVNIRTGAALNNVMKPMGLAGRKGDTDSFVLITSELGRKWNETPVSCPIPSVGGYGGAMGPAQFIPTTWIAYRNKVANIIGKAPDPWSIKDAFIAAALYLADYGAAKRTYNDEWRAAMIYFSGTTNTKYRFYGDSVLSIASRLESDIKQIEASQ